MISPARVLFLFVDGIGLGPDAEANPFATLSLPAFESASGGRWTAGHAAIGEQERVFKGIDATLGVPGLPQSGTGQATLFTGINGAALAGRHFGPFPHSATRPAVAEHNLFRQVQRRFPAEPEPAAFANAYPERFFEWGRQRDRWTVTTRCCLDASVRIRTEADWKAGLAVPANLTGKGWPSPSAAPAAISERTAAEYLLAVSRRHRLTLFEFYLTDKAGHAQSAEQAAGVLRSLDRFLARLFAGLPPDTLFLLTSDHGNVEDLSIKTHTLNPVPLLGLGPGAVVLSEVGDLQGVLPAVMAAFG